MAYLHFLNFKVAFLFYYMLSIAYTHFRGLVRLKPLKQLTDHSSLMAPINLIMYLFSATPKTPYVSVELFPELKLLQDNWQLIRDEALDLLNENYISASDKHDDIGFNSFFRRGWKRFYLKWYQDPMDSAQKLCPKTLALIKQIPSINAAMFAILPKNSFLFKHRDPYAGSLRYHLGLITPNSPECGITVDGQHYYWKDGEAVMFDETFIHHAENTSDQDRIILFCDIRRPLTNSLANWFNKLFSNTVMKAAASKNLATESVGLINKIFAYIYKIRLLGKKIKEFNRGLYYCIKYILFLALVYWLFFS